MFVFRVESNMSFYHQKDELDSDSNINYMKYPPKFNIAPEKWWLEDYLPIGKATFQGRTVTLWESSLLRSKSLSFPCGTAKIMFLHFIGG